MTGPTDLSCRQECPQCAFKWTTRIHFLVMHEADKRIMFGLHRPEQLYALTYGDV